jgi:plasmid rolling circle replication initiator protein Rep
MNYNINSLLDEHDFRDKKKLQEPIFNKYQYFNIRRAKALEECARYLEFGLYQNLKDGEIKTKKLERMYTCKDRFCPFCNWRRARKLAIQSYEVLEALEADRKVRYLFVTLTVKNCKIEDLSDTINKMNKAFLKMFRWKRLKDSTLGYARILEYPPQKTNTEYMHPHYHCLIAVPTKYFGRDKNLYIKQEEWQALWKKALNIDYDPSVDVRIIKAKNSQDPIAKAVAEFAKYPLKSIDIEPLSVEQFALLVDQMNRKRAVAFGGILKEYRKKLQLDDVEDGDLIYSDNLKDSEWQKIASLIYQYKSGDKGIDYYLTKRTKDF